VDVKIVKVMGDATIVIEDSSSIMDHAPLNVLIKQEQIE
jgi:hypothetical protein